MWPGGCWPGPGPASPPAAGIEEKAALSWSGLSFSCCCISGCFSSCSRLVNSLPSGKHRVGSVSIKVGLECVNRGLKNLNTGHCIG